MSNPPAQIPRIDEENLITGFLDIESNKKLIDKFYNENELKKEGFSVNGSKTRISYKGGQQKVTGLVVNEKVQPPRKFRRNIRAAFHNAEKDPERGYKNIERLRGYYNYLNMFESFYNSQEKIKYKNIIDFLKNIK